MRLLLDTHVLLALFEGRIGTLGAALDRELRSPAHEFHVSVASLWEIAIKWRLGKLPLQVPPERLPELLDELGLVTLAIAPAHATAAVVPEPATRDPFDRLLLAVCATEDMRLVTVDRALAGHPLAFKP